MEAEQKDSYKQIVKATSIFGGVQVFQILISIIRSKFVAVLLGPAGMGIYGLLTSTISLVTGFTNFGLGTSAVKNIAHSFSTGDEKKIAITVAIVRKLVWYTGLLGFMVTLFFASLLSQLTFGNTNYTWAFVWLSITLLINQVSTGQGVILRGTRRIKNMAKSSIIGSFLGLFTSIPLYYFYGADGIVPAVILTSLTTLLLTWYFSSKVPLQKVKVLRKDISTEGKAMMKLGFMLSLSSLITIAASYILRAYIGHIGGVKQVGFFTAGFAIVNTYVGMIFTAMSTDYFPRLSAVSDDYDKRTKLVNQQAEIALLILGPILCVFIVFGTIIINLLYSSKFVAVGPMVQWAALGIFFMGASWPMGFVLLAKGNSKSFFWNELASNIYGLVFNVLGYYYYGLTGLGISFFLIYVCHFFQIYFVIEKKYGFAFENQYIKFFIYQFALGLCCFLVSIFIINPYSYILGLLLITISVFISYRVLNTIFGLSDMLKKVIKR